MITKIEINNFKSLKDVTLDLAVKGKLRRAAFLYGENGSGKSNLIDALYYLFKSMRTLLDENTIKALPSRREGIYPELSSSDLDFAILNSHDDIIKLSRGRFMLSNKEALPIRISLSFEILGRNGSYEIVVDDEGFKSEKLTYSIGSRSGILFSINREEIRLSPTAFDDRSFRAEIGNLVKAYYGPHSLMAILFSLWKKTNGRRFENRISSSLLEVLTFFDRVAILSSDGSLIPKEYGGDQILYGYVDRLGEGGLDRIERLLNHYFHMLFKNIKRVYYRTSDRGGRLFYELAFVRNINGEDVTISVQEESKGIRRLAELFPFIMSALSSSISIVDDADESIHEVVLLKLALNLYEEASGQFITTMHNTLLMKELPQNSVYIIRDVMGERKEILSISDYSFRTQKTNNVQIKYLQGDYDGIPRLGSGKFSDLILSDEK